MSFLARAHRYIDPTDVFAPHGLAAVPATPALVQWKSAKIRNSINSPIVLDAAPTVGNKLIAFVGTRDYDIEYVPATGMTGAVSGGQNSRRGAQLLYRDVIEGDGASRAFPIGDRDCRVTVAEFSGLAAGAPTLFDIEAPAAVSITANADGLVVATLCREVGGAPDPAGATGIDYGPVYEDVNPNMQAAYQLGYDGITYTWSYANGDSGAVMAFWPVGVATATQGTKEHLNAKLLPNVVDAQTDFAYLTTDGTDDGVGYLKS